MTPLKTLICALSLAATFAVVACGSEHDAAVDKLEALAEEVCACKDAACVDEVEAKMEAFMKENAELKGKDVPEETVEKLQAAGKKAFACMQTIRK